MFRTTDTSLLSKIEPVVYQNTDYEISYVYLGQCIIKATLRGKPQVGDAIKTLECLDKVLVSLEASGIEASCFIIANVLEFKGFAIEDRKIFRKTLSNYFQSGTIEQINIVSTNYFLRTLFTITSFLVKVKHQFYRTEEEALKAILKKQKKISKPSEKPKKLKNKTPKDLQQCSREELTSLLEQSQEENQTLRSLIQKRTSELFEVIAQVTWDKRIDTQIPSIDEQDEFYHLFCAMHALQEDVYNLLKKNKFSTKNLENLVKQRSEQLIQKEADLSSLIENTKDFICLIDKSYKLRIINSAYRNYILYKYGYVPEVGEYFLKDFSEELYNYWKPIYDKALNGEAFNLIKEVREKDEENVFFEISFNPIIGNKGNVIGISIFAKDITLLKRNEKRLQEKNADLEKVNNELDNFVYSVSHDLSSPIKSLIGLVNIYKLEEDVEKKDSYINLMEESILKLNKFINNIVTYSRNSRLDLRIENINFDILLEEVLDQLENFPRREKVYVRKIVKQEDAFFSDKERLIVILKNLISNAIRYADLKQEKPEVFVQIKTISKRVTIVVKDNGIGIGKEYQDKIFNIFYNATDRNTGSGLGLYIVRETVNKLKGSIRLESVLGKGSTFIVEF